MVLKGAKSTPPLCRQAYKSEPRARIKDQMRIFQQGFGPAIFLPQLPGRSVCP
jgi:hypothetical protein